jgi:hypothetical protein
MLISLQASWSTVQVDQVKQYIQNSVVGLSVEEIAHHLGDNPTNVSPLLYLGHTSCYLNVWCKLWNFSRI